MSDDFDKFIEDLQNEVNEDVQRQYSPNALDLMARHPNHGVLKDATCKGSFRADDGETISFYLEVKNDIIQKATYITNGCQPAHAAGSQVTLLVRGKTMKQAEGISADVIWRAIGKMPEDTRHSVVLAEMALKKAIE
nr:iron-sulfur cluster assembly scaffold protein [Candidatus Sigynarchaeota archaeon]